MIDTLYHWLFPDQIRILPAARAWSISLRTLHIAAFGMVLGGHAFAVEAGKLLPWMWVTILSGVGLVVLELYSGGLYWLFLGKGISVLVKLTLLLLIPLFWEQRMPLLLLVVGIASVGSHMPSRFRHYSILHGRAISPAETLRNWRSARGSNAVTVTPLEEHGKPGYHGSRSTIYSGEK